MAEPLKDNAVIQKLGYLLCRGMDPSGNGECDFRVALKQVKHLQALGPESKYYELFSAHEVLQHPEVIFEDLRRDGHDRSMCYVGKPNCFRERVKHPPHPGMVFSVYITKAKVIFEWGWELEDKDNPGLPIDIKRRFGKTLWTRSSTT